MDEARKISTSQLLVLLALSRLFSVIAYSPSVQGGAEGLTPVSALLSGALQFPLLWAGLCLCRRKAGFSPLMAPGAAFYRLQCLLYWGCCMAVCVDTAVNFISFMTAAVYGYRYGWVVALTFAAAGALAASQGLEGLARGGGILAALLAAGCAAVALGLWRQYDWHNLSLRLFSAGGVLQGAYRGFAMNGELFALLLLLLHLREPPRAASCAGWVGAMALATAAVQLMTALTLGAYGAFQPYPVFTAVTAAGFRVFQRLDAVFLAVWVVLGLMKFALFLALASSLSAGAFFRPWGAKWVWGCGGAAAALSLLLWAGREEWLDGLRRLLASGALTALGLLVLPLLGKLLDRREEKG